MSFAKLVIIQPGHASRELKVEQELLTIGRALDNTVALEDDSNVSRYHIEIESRGDAFWLLDLGSSNGTTVNDQPVDLERKLIDGDLISLGGSTIIEFHLRDTPYETSDDGQQTSLPTTAPVDTPPIASANAAGAVDQTAAIVPTVTPPVPSVAPTPSGLSPFYIAGAIVGGLLITAAVGAILYFSSSRGCQATARIVSPQNGTIVKGPIPIRVDAEQTQCIDRLIYQLDGVKVASSEIAPYQATLDPADISGLTPGNHVLTVIVEDDKGNRSIQADEVLLGFEKAQSSSGNDSQDDNRQKPPGDNDGLSTKVRTFSAADVKQMSERLIRQLSGRHEYILNRELLHQIEARTADYATPGFYSRARPFRDVINDSFVNEQGLEKPLGYILAMSRSNFDLSRNRSAGTADGDGLWRVPLALAQTEGYIGRCGTATLSDQNQKCAAMVTAAYLKALEVDLFGGDPLYAVACFGMSPKDAAQWRDQLPADRRDLWNVIRSPEQRDRVARFFAAGIVGENPQQFGLGAENPLSNLYPK
jgi:hypothetical protein